MMPDHELRLAITEATDRILERLRAERSARSKLGRIGLRLGRCAGGYIIADALTSLSKTERMDIEQVHSWIDAQAGGVAR